MANGVNEPSGGVLKVLDVVVVGPMRKGHCAEAGEVARSWRDGIGHLDGGGRGARAHRLLLLLLLLSHILLLLLVGIGMVGVGA